MTKEKQTKNKTTGIDRRQFLFGTLAMSVFMSVGIDSLAMKRKIALQTGGKKALSFTHLESNLKAFLWRNWFLVPTKRLAKVLAVDDALIMEFGEKIGLPRNTIVEEEQFARSYITILRRNWHILPESQILTLLDWDKNKLSYMLKEDDFLGEKLGPKPNCELVKFNYNELKEPSNIKRIISQEFGNDPWNQKEPLFYFIKELSTKPTHYHKTKEKSGFSPRFGYSFFTLFGDPLLDPKIDPFPPGYLDRMTISGMDSTWLHIVLSKLTPFPWDSSISKDWEIRLNNLQKLVDKCNNHGIGIYLYLNEPRYMPLSFYETYPQYKGVERNGEAALCTSHPDIQKYIVDSIALIVEKVPGLAGFFSITASENPTNCWSHGQGNKCPRCSIKGPEKTIYELNTLYQNGIDQGFAKIKNQKGRKYSDPKLIVYDWGWRTEWVENIIDGLPKKCYLMSVSERDLPIIRGKVESKVGEYSISSIGPSKRSLDRWKYAKQCGLKTIAKIQTGNSWEIAAVPYIPALENVAEHAWNLKQANVDGIMLGWSLGAYPSPNMEVVTEISKNTNPSVIDAMRNVAKKRYGPAANEIVNAWIDFSKAFREFPFHISVVYAAPLQVGPSNILWDKPTGFSSTIVGIPYDDVHKWRAIYPAETFVTQLLKVAEGFRDTLNKLKTNVRYDKLTDSQKKSFDGECSVAETIYLHYKSVANQTLFTLMRDEILQSKNISNQKETVLKLKTILTDEIALAKRMFHLQKNDSRLGFEASNHYFYIPVDLVEKVINCTYLIENWIPTLDKSSQT